MNVFADEIDKITSVNQEIYIIGYAFLLWLILYLNKKFFSVLELIISP